MLRLRTCVLSHLVSSASLPGTLSSLHCLRLLSATAAHPVPGFAVEDYLVATCGLTRAQALKASTKLSHLKSPSNPDAALALLAGLGLSGADVAAAVTKDPKLLCSRVESTLSPNVAELSRIGLSRAEIARFVSLFPFLLRRRSVASKVHYYVPIFGSWENLLRALRSNSSLLKSDLDRVVKPNLALLRECQLSACQIASLCLHAPRLLTASPGRVRAMLRCAEGLGVPRGSGMLRQMLCVVARVSEKEIAAKMECCKKAFGWSDAEARVAVCRAPRVLSRSKDKLQQLSEFLVSEVGFDPPFVAQRSEMLTYSLEGRLRPRFYVVKFLKENGLLDHNRIYSATVMMTEKEFMDKYVLPHKEVAPRLAQEYSAACRGSVPPRFTF